MTKFRIFDTIHCDDDKTAEWILETLENRGVPAVIYDLDNVGYDISVLEKIE